MMKQILMGGTIAIFATALGGCAMNNPGAHLPPPHLGEPVVTQYAPRAPQPLPPSPKLAQAPVPKQPVAIKASSSAVPAGWVPTVATNNWTWIIIHHSDSSFGSAALIDQWHKTRGFDELGYHFVIGNGTNSGDGQIEIGPRWTKQKWGAHDNALDNRYNKQGIGICLVGDFNKTAPTAAQKRSLIRLVAYLMKTYHVSPDHILGHGDTKDTECPGRNLHVAEIRAAATSLAESEMAPDSDAVASK